MLITALLTGTALAGSADGIDHEFSLESSGIYTSDPTFDAFGYSSMLSASGVRLGYGLTENVTIVGGWSLGRYRSNVEVSTEESFHDFNMDLSAHQLRLGPKVDLQVLHWLRPYATVQGIGMLGRLSIDEHPDDDDSVVFTYSDTAFGGFAAAGLDVVPGSSSHRIHPAGYLEMGYGKVLALQFEDTDAGNAAVEIGDLDFQGFTINIGLGVRF